MKAITFTSQTGRSMPRYIDQAPSTAQITGCIKQLDNRGQETITFTVKGDSKSSGGNMYSVDPVFNKAPIYKVTKEESRTSIFARAAQAKAGQAPIQPEFTDTVAEINACIKEGNAFFIYNIGVNQNTGEEVTYLNNIVVISEGVMYDVYSAGKFIPEVIADYINDVLAIRLAKATPEVAA